MNQYAAVQWPRMTYAFLDLPETQAHVHKQSVAVGGWRVASWITERAEPYQSGARAPDRLRTYSIKGFMLPYCLAAQCRAATCIEIELHPKLLSFASSLDGAELDFLIANPVIVDGVVVTLKYHEGFCWWFVYFWTSLELRHLILLK